MVNDSPVIIRPPGHLPKDPARVQSNFEFLVGNLLEATNPSCIVLFWPALVASGWQTELLLAVERADPTLDYNSWLFPLPNMLQTFPDVNPFCTIPWIVERLVHTTPRNVMPGVHILDDYVELSQGTVRVDIKTPLWVRDVIFNGLGAWVVRHGLLHPERPMLRHPRIQHDYVLCGPQDPADYWSLESLQLLHNNYSNNINLRHGPFSYLSAAADAPDVAD